VSNPLEEYIVDGRFPVPLEFSSDLYPSFRTPRKLQTDVVEVEYLVVKDFAVLQNSPVHEMRSSSHATGEFLLRRTHEIAGSRIEYPIRGGNERLERQNDRYPGPLRASPFRTHLLEGIEVPLVRNREFVIRRKPHRTFLLFREFFPRLALDEPC